MPAELSGACKCWGHSGKGMTPGPSLQHGLSPSSQAVCWDPQGWHLLQHLGWHLLQCLCAFRLIHGHCQSRHRVCQSPCARQVSVTVSLPMIQCCSNACRWWGRMTLCRSKACLMWGRMTQCHSSLERDLVWLDHSQLPALHKD